MLIIAGSLMVEPSQRAAFLAANADVVGHARQAAGCLDFVQAADIAILMQPLRYASPISAGEWLESPG